MASGQNFSQKNEAMDVDDYVMRLRTGGEKTQLVQRRGERRAEEDRRSGLDRRMRWVPVREDRRRNVQARRSWSERRIARDRRDLQIEYLGANSQASIPLPSTGTNARKRGFFQTLLTKTGFIE